MVATTGVPAVSGEEAGPVAANAGARAEQVFADHFASLCRTAFLVVGDSCLAEELVMEAFARTLPRWHAVESADQPVAYLRRAVVNLCLSRVRRLRLERRATSVRAAGEAQWDVDVAASQAVLDAVRLLPMRQRACVVLRYFDDLPEQEIAAALGCSVGTVKSQLAKARARLAALLEEGSA